MNLNTKLIQLTSSKLLNNVADCGSVIQVPAAAVDSSHYRMVAVAAVVLVQPQRLADWAVVAAVVSGGGGDGDDGVVATVV